MKDYLSYDYDLIPVELQPEEGMTEIPDCEGQVDSVFNFKSTAIILVSVMTLIFLLSF